MLSQLYQCSDIAVFTFLSSAIVLISWIIIYLVKKVVPLQIRYQDNGVIGYVASLISVIYGVLSGLAALYLINNNSYTADAVQREANAVANTYHMSLWLPEPIRSQIKVEIQNYILKVTQVDWPLMKNGNDINREGDQILETIEKQLRQYYGTRSSDPWVVHELLQNIKTLYNARQQRINMSYAQLSPEMWVVIVIGTILMLCVNYLFGMNFYLHIFTVTAAGLMTAAMMFLLITLDRPFQGEFAIQPTAFNNLLVHMKNNNPL